MRRSRALPEALVAWVIAAATVPAVVAAAALSARFRQGWTVDPLGRVTSVVLFASIALICAGGAALVARRPSNRCGMVAVALGATMAGWWAASLYWGYQQTWRGFVTDLLVTALRPLLFWLVLAFPVGRLDRVSRRVWRALLAGEAVAFAAWGPSYFGAWHDARWTRLVHSAWWDVGAFLAAAAVLVVVRRRSLRVHREGASVAVPALWAAAVAAGADFVLVAQGPLRFLANHSGRTTPFGAVVTGTDLGRWGVVVAILAVAARRAWPQQTTGTGDVELGPSGVDDTLRVSFRELLDDPTAEVLIHDGQLGWVDLAGHRCDGPGTRRPATVLSHDGEALAALEYDEAVRAHPTVVDAAVTALALRLESDRQITIARAREVELRRLAGALVDADDAARRRLEHDLHDGAQQMLVGASLQAALAARAGDAGGASDLAEVARAIEDARGVLSQVASGRPPALLVERGLHGALGALAVTATVPVRVDIDPCDDLDDAVQRAIWFTAAEAVTNALKHARASTIEIELRRDRDITLVVADDGCGGVIAPPASLAWRVDSAGGQLQVESARAGTRVRATFPISAAVVV